MLKQKLQQKLLQKLSPQQIQMIKLLEVPAIQLEQRIKKELDENPMLEINEAEDYQEPQTNQDNSENQELDPDQNEFTFEDYFDEEEYVPAYKLNTNNFSPDDNFTEKPYMASTSFHELLENQLSELRLDDREITLAMHIIGSIDDDGYLRRDLNTMVDDIAFNHNIQTTYHELEKILFSIQEFEPIGVGSRNLQECLLLQIEVKDLSVKSIQLAHHILKNFFEEFTKKHYQKIASRLNLNDQEIKSAIDEILKLNPKPGSLFSDPASNSIEHITPDFILEQKEGELYLSLNKSNIPDLKLNKNYSELAENLKTNKNLKTTNQKELMSFVKQKTESARWFIEAIKQRQVTLLLTMEAILKYQENFFRNGEEKLLRPMILKDIAEISGLDISTISRVANSKYIQTHFGVYPLKYFFSEGFQNDLGEEISTREIKNYLRECIDNEDKSKPLNDDELVEILKEKGYKVARRTIAKYRDQLEIPVARLRKELN